MNTQGDYHCLGCYVRGQCLGWSEHGTVGARDTGTVNGRGNLSKVKGVTRKMG